MQNPLKKSSWSQFYDSLASWFEDPVFLVWEISSIALKQTTWVLKESEFNLLYARLLTDISSGSFNPVLFTFGRQSFCQRIKPKQPPKSGLQAVANTVQEELKRYFSLNLYTHCSQTHLFLHL